MNCNVSIDYLIGRNTLKYDPDDYVIEKLIEKYTSLSDEEKIDFVRYINNYKQEN